MEIQLASMDIGQAANVRDTIAPVELKKASGSETPAQQKTAPDESLSSEQVKQMVKQITQHLSSMNVSLDFTPYGERGEKMAVIVSDKDTGKVIREIPSKELRDLYMKMNELIGIMFNRHI